MKALLEGLTAIGKQTMPCLQDITWMSSKDFAGPARLGMMTVWVGCPDGVFPERLGEAGVIEEHEALAGDKPGHSIGITDARQCADYEEPVITAQHAADPLDISLK